MTKRSDVRVWQHEESWCARVLLFGYIPGFGRSKDREQAITDALDSGDRRARLVFQEMKEKYEPF